MQINVYVCWKTFSITEIKVSGQPATMADYSSQNRQRNRFLGDGGIIVTFVVLHHDTCRANSQHSYLIRNMFDKAEYEYIICIYIYDIERVMTSYVGNLWYIPIFLYIYSAPDRSLNLTSVQLLSYLSY